MAKRYRELLPVLLTCLVPLACGGAPPLGDDGGPGPDAGDTSGGDDGVPDDPCEYGAAVFDDSLVHSIELTLDDEDWAALIEIGTDACEYCDDPRPYFPAEMTVDGVALPEDVGVRLKGHWSLMNADWENHIFPLKIDFNRYAPGQTFEGLKKLNLHPNQDDVNAIIEYVAYRAIRETLIDGTTPVPASRTSFVRVTVNGEDVGLYSAVEQVGGAFLDCHFPEPRGHMYKPEEPSEHLSLPFTSYEEYPALNFKWGPEELESPPPEVDHSAVGHMINESHEGLAALEAVVDADGILAYHAANVAIGNHDYYGSYGHNYYLYELEPGVFTLIVWDLNGSLGHYWGPCGAENGGKPLNEHLLRDPGHVDRYEQILEDFLLAAIDSVEQSFDHAVDLVVPEDYAEDFGYWKDEIIGETEGMLAEVQAGIDTCDE